MSYSEPSATNVYLPTTGDAEASAYMISGFSRNVNKFSLPRILEIRPVTQMNGNFLRWRSEQAMRVRYSDGRDLAWPIGQPRPSGQDNMELFEFEPFACQRKQKSFPLPREVRQQAAWPIQAWQATVPAGQIMTERVIAANNCLANATWSTNQAYVDGSYGTLNGNAALLGSGHNWTNGSATNPYIKTSLLKAWSIITKVTGASVSIEDFCLVVSPDDAVQMAVSPEIHAIMANSVFAYGLLDGSLWYNEEWALPDKIGGFRVVVEKTPFIGDRKQSAAAPLSAYSYAFPSGSAYLLYRPQARTQDGKAERAFVQPNAIAGKEDGNPANYFPALSSLVMFAYEEFTVETFESEKDRIEEGSVTTNYAMALTSWKSAFQFQKVTG